MRKRVFRFLSNVLTAAIISLPLTASAFWWDPPGDRASGLDLAGGFDVNTVTTLTGSVTTPPAPRDGGPHTEMLITTPSGETVVILGPWEYWKGLGVTIAAGEEVTVTGSRAVGRDGKSYLFAQSIERTGTGGERITLRDQSGRPAWSRSGAGGSAPAAGGRSGEGYRYRGGGARGGRR